MAIVAAGKSEWNVNQGNFPHSHLCWICKAYLHAWQKMKCSSNFPWWPTIFSTINKQVFEPGLIKKTGIPVLLQYKSHLKSWCEIVVMVWVCSKPQTSQLVQYNYHTLSAFSVTPLGISTWAQTRVNSMTQSVPSRGGSHLTFSSQEHMVPNPQMLKGSQSVPKYLQNTITSQIRINISDIVFWHILQYSCFPRKPYPCWTQNMWAGPHT